MVFVLLLLSPLGSLLPLPLLLLRPTPSHWKGFLPSFPLLPPLRYLVVAPSDGLLSQLLGVFLRVSQSSMAWPSIEIHLLLGGQRAGIHPYHSMPPYDLISQLLHSEAGRRAKVVVGQGLQLHNSGGGWSD